MAGTREGGGGNCVCVYGWCFRLEKYVYRGVLSPLPWGGQQAAGWGEREKAAGFGLCWVGSPLSGQDGCKEQAPPGRRRTPPCSRGRGRASLRRRPAVPDYGPATESLLLRDPRGLSGCLGLGTHCGNTAAGRFLAPVPAALPAASASALPHSHRSAACKFREALAVVFTADRGLRRFDTSPARRDAPGSGQPGRYGGWGAKAPAGFLA